MNKRAILVGFVGMVMMLGASRASSQGWGVFPYASSCWGCGYASVYATESIPYYALYPPVYYSYRVARTYGYSPFAYPPGVLTPGSEPPRAIVQNVSPGTAGETDSQQGPQPLKIDNPYVEQSGGPGMTKGGQPIGRRPHVVYPAAVAAAK